MTDSTIISVFALATSFISLWLTRRIWLDTNCPIVCVFVEEDSISGGASTFNFCLSNTGNRPAIDIQIEIDAINLERILDQSAGAHERALLRKLFEPTRTIPLLRNGETLKAGLGHAGAGFDGKEQLSYGATAELRVKYKEFGRRTFSEVNKICIFPRSGFNWAGVWQRAS